MSEPEAPELLPCPFCGSKAVLTNVRMSGHAFKVGCYDDLCWRPGTDFYSNAAEAIAAWNRRSPVAISEDAVELAARAMHDVMWGATGAGKEAAWLGMRATLIRHAEAALSAALVSPAVTVKTLKWKRSPSSNMSRAETMLGTYRVWTHQEAEGLWFWDYQCDPAHGKAQSEAEAQAAAQADYESRIRSALVPNGSAEPVAFLDQTGELHTIGYNFKAVFAAMPEPPVGKKLLPLYALPIASAGEPDHFLTAFASKDGKVTGIDHETCAAWNDVRTAHVALRDWLNERIANEDKCPFFPCASAGEAGWRTVPVEPTDEMIDAMVEQVGSAYVADDPVAANRNDCRDAYRAMLAAAPLPVHPTGPKP